MTGTVTGESRRAWENVPVGAEHYERELVPELFAPWARELVEAVDLRAGERVLDLACGTGVVARAAAPRVGMSGSITGVDVNGDMLAVARRVSRTTTPVIIWRQADAHHTGLADRAFDVALCQQGLQFFADRRSVVRELHRVLAPGGRLAASVWCGAENPGYVPISSALQRRLPDAPQAAAFVHAIFGLSDAGQLKQLLVEAGFVDVRVTVRTRPVGFATAEAWVRAFLRAAPATAAAVRDPAVQERVVADAVAELDPDATGGPLTFPMTANVATARR